MSWKNLLLAIVILVVSVLGAFVSILIYNLFSNGHEGLIFLVSWFLIFYFLAVAVDESKTP